MIMSMKKISWTMVFRLLRPLLHMVVLGLLFWGLYRVRLHTDLIPLVQVRVPPIIVSELVIFARISMLLFVLIGLSRGLYQLRGTSRYKQLFFKTRGSRFVVTVFVAFLGSGFVFP